MGSKVSMSPGATGIGFTAATYGTILGLKTGTDDRTPNTVAYVTPALMGGLTFTAAYINGENASTLTAAKRPTVDLEAYQWQLAAQYENGPLYLGIGYHKAEDPQVLARTSCLPLKPGLVYRDGASRRRTRGVASGRLVQVLVRHEDQRHVGQPEIQFNSTSALSAMARSSGMPGNWASPRTSARTRSTASIPRPTKPRPTATRWTTPASSSTRLATTTTSASAPC